MQQQSRSSDSHSQDSARLRRRRALVRFAWLSIAASLLVIALKTLAWWLTGSVGLLSDAAESVVNLAGGIMALVMLSIAARPADHDHQYGHDKAEYFSSGLEGALIFLASVGIIVVAVNRLLNPQPIEMPVVGLALSAVATLINLAAARVLLSAGRREESITLEADGHHLMTDVWTSVGVIGGVALVAVTGWYIVDPLIALLVAANISYTGWKVFMRSVNGLMDSALDEHEIAEIQRILDHYGRQHNVDFHALRTRQSGARRFISMHVLMPGDWTVQRGHDVADAIENAIQDRFSGASVITHLEPVEDPRSYRDISLDRD
ncbi:cation diffusion facilitator family transporter [Methylonatrum kenyense]|uniref:cation diffusion facilitator family transporter n=1 Tax=Methylonatrum kenyense TaxID=455253 RepID=UPI0020BE05BB|nr:cation diffusion facilitator family transporter [Methylonatrum kenyense]MCK8517088.1 cation diffusion facilitator family transporter [Methylonatrum kenyense]